ncbi:DUF1488 family protein [Caballeronia ptereochthonis]
MICINARIALHAKTEAMYLDPPGADTPFAHVPRIMAHKGYPTMNITFPQQAPVYLSDEPALTFWALADGERVPCTVSAEALEDHFGATSWREEDLQRAFEDSRAVIEGAAEQLLTSVGRRPVMLRSGYFRFSDGAPMQGVAS